MLKKIVPLILIVSISLFSLTGCYDVKGIEEMSYAIALGIDESSNSSIELTLQFAINSDYGSGGESTQYSGSTITSIQCSSINSGIALINSYISKEVSLSHCEVIVISEALASRGISDYLYTLVNNIEIRPDCDIIISRCAAKDFLSNSSPTLEALSARYYESILDSTYYTGYTDTVTLHEFYSNYKDNYSECYAILGGINSNATHRDNSTQLNGQYYADQVPIEDKNILENMGLAVFKGDKLIGELNNLETLCHLMLKNNLERCMLSVASPFTDNKLIDLQITKDKNSTISASIINGSPYFECNVFLNALVFSSDTTSDYSTEENLNFINETTSAFLENQINSYLYKTSKNFNSDILGLGKYLVDDYLFWEDWTNVSWLNLYKDSFFNVNVETKVENGYLFTKN